MNYPQSLVLVAEEESQVQMHRSGLASLSIALLLHALLIAVLAFVIVGIPEEEIEPITVIAQAEERPLDKPKMDVMSPTFQKPQAPSMNAAALVPAAAPAPVEIPIADDFDATMIGLPGDGIGPGIGEAFGPGTRGSKIFGPIPPGSRRIVLAIDVSTSMRKVFGDTGIAAIRKEIRRTLNALPPGTAFNIVTFGNLADGFARRLVPAGAEQKKDAVAFMDWYYQSDQFRTRTSQFDNRGRDADGTSYQPILPDEFRVLRGTTGGSRIDLALVAAFGQKADTVYLFTDGAPSTRKDGQPLAREELIDLVKRSADKEYRNGPKPVVNCVGVNGVAEDYLREIAKTFGGEYTDITPDSLY